MFVVYFKTKKKNESVKNNSLSISEKNKKKKSLVDIFLGFSFLHKKNNVIKVCKK